MKRLVILLAISSLNILFPQNILKISKDAESKILSGRLLEKIYNLQNESTNSLKKPVDTKIILYFSEYPSDEQLKQLQALGVQCYLDTWTPPLENHPLGFCIASIQVKNITDVLSLQFVIKMDTAERVCSALNNSATQSIRAPLVWDKGFTGTGVKIGILDSGIDISYAGADLPASFQYKDYSNYPILDNDVANKTTGHGTHVTATALGRGVLSEGQVNVNNGKGAFKGSAPGADLVFLKIGGDTTSGANDASIIAAIDAAVNIYKVDVLSMSYGGWDDYHDGSSATEQKVDWAYSQGVPFFCSAGNSANSSTHYSGTVNAFSESEYIQVNVSNAGNNDTKLRFNLVWNDGSKRNNITMQCYNSSKQLLGNITVLPATESLRGIESVYLYSNNYLPMGNGAYYLRVTNNSADVQAFHIYEDWSNQENGNNKVYFSSPDPYYTIGSPAGADHAFSVGAYISRTIWSDYQNNSWWWGDTYIYNNIAPYSSLGPTLDGRIKPDICAPGHAIISLRDNDVYKTKDYHWVDNDGVVGGEANYYEMHGTSMACPVTAGAAALFIQKYPGIQPEQIYKSFKDNSNISGLTNIPNNTWGYGKLDIYSVMEGTRENILVDGTLNEDQYTILAEFTSGRNGFGDNNKLGAIKYYTDGENLYIGITGEVSGDNNIILFMDFSGVQGRGTNYLGGGNSGDFVYSVFSYLGNVKMDFDADFALAFNGGNSTLHEFYFDAIKYGTSNTCANIGKLNRMGAGSNYDISSVFGGKGYITAAYDSNFYSNSNKGVEFKIPISAFAGVDTSQTLSLFAVITSMSGDVSNVCIPGDPGVNNLGNSADFSEIANQNFYTDPVKISSKEMVSGFDISKTKPAAFLLEQNYPNPFNPSTVISYQLPVSSKVILKVYNTLGEEIKTLVNEFQIAGFHSIQFTLNSSLSSGIYFYQLKAGDFSSTKKMIILR
jgi:hypothetical protein